MGLKVKVDFTSEAYWLCSLEYAKRVVGYKDCTTALPEDQLISDAISAASDTIQSGYCHRIFAYENHTEQWSGNGIRHIIHVTNPPINETPVLQFWDDPDHEWGSDTKLVLHDDYEIDHDAGKIIAYAPFTAGILNLRGIYRGGFEFVPASVQEGCAIWVAINFRPARDMSHGVASKAGDGMTESFILEEMPEMVKAKLEQWVRPVIR